MRKGALLLPFALLAGCFRTTPHVRPELPTPPVYLAPSDSAPTTGVRATEVAWREFFRDPRLGTLIATALTNNRDLRVSVAQIEVARGLYRIQGADRLPTVVASADATRTHAGAAASGLPDEIAQAQRAFRLLLIQDVASTYLQAIEAGEQVRLAEATAQSRRDAVRIAQVRLRAGLTSALDFHQAESLLEQAQAALAGLQLSQARLNNQLFVLVGGPVPQPLPDPLPLTEQTNPVVLASGLPSELLLSRPDIMAAEERLRAAEANVGAARAAYFPSISLTGALGFASSALSSLVGNDGLTWSAGTSIAAPIFNRGRLTGNAAVARAQETIAVADYERTVQVAFQEVSNALAGRRFLANQVAAQERGTLAQRQIAALARTRYAEGVVAYIEVLDAERNLFASEQTLLQLRRAEVENLVSLYVALGGGSVETRSTP